MSPLWVLVCVSVGMLIASFCCGLMAALGWRAGGRPLPRPAATAAPRRAQLAHLRGGQQPRHQRVRQAPTAHPDRLTRRQHHLACPGLICFVRVCSLHRTCGRAGLADTPTRELRPYTWRPPHVPWPREGTDR